LDFDAIDRSAVPEAEMKHWHAVLEMLRERSREVFLLATVDRLSYPEIARTLRITVGCVRRHMVKVIAHLDRHRFRG
jgi:RNA polymerase sigma-70 factor (ECF subfamily)